MLDEAEFKCPLCRSTKMKMVSLHGRKDLDGFECSLCRYQAPTADFVSVKAEQNEPTGRTKGPFDKKVFLNEVLAKSRTRIIVFFGQDIADHIFNCINAHDELVAENEQLKKQLTGSSSRCSDCRSELIYVGLQNDDNEKYDCPVCLANSIKDELVAALKEELTYWLKELNEMSEFDRDAFPELYKEYKERFDAIKSALKSAGVK